MNREMDARQLYRGIIEDDRTLRTLLKSNPSELKEIQVVRKRFIDKAEALVALDAGFAASKEIEQVLWKPCYYRRIEEFRLRIRKYASAATSDARVRQHFVQISSDFRRFLDEATAFYERLHQSFRRYFEKKDMPESTRLKCRQSCNRVLIFLGDLARYRELHSQKSKKNFSKAEGYYYKALAVLPQNGNPHNQLAVLATYVEAECVAVYRYCRSLLVRHPFATSKENLSLLFEKNRQRPPTPKGPDVLYGNSRQKDKSMKLKNFLERFIKIQGVLFAYHPQNRPSGGDRPNFSNNSQEALCKDLALLLDVGAIGDSLVLKIFIVCIYSLVCLRDVAETSSQQKEIYQHAVSLALDLTVQAIEYISAKEPTELSDVSESSGANRFRLLGPIAVVCDFLRLSKDILQSADHERSRSRFMKALAGLLNYLQPAYGLTETMASWKDHLPILKESIELRGFLPLEGLPYYNTSDIIENSISEDCALEIRAKKLLDFGSFLCSELKLLRCDGLTFSIMPTSGRSPLFRAMDEESDIDIPNDAEDAADMEEDVDEDEEVIVFQPKFQPPSQPTLTPISRVPDISLKNSDNGNILSGFQNPVGLGLDYLSSGNTTFSPFGGEATDLSSNFALPDTDNNLTSFGWSNSDVTSQAFLPSFMGNSTLDTDSMFATEGGLDALELETNRYMQEESSLSKLMNAPRESPSHVTPPPGFSSSSLDSSVEDAKSSESNGLYTTNPFIIGNS